MMTIKYGLQFFFFFELTDNDGQKFLAGIVLVSVMTEYIHTGPTENLRLPPQPLGILFFNEIQKCDANRTLVVNI
jgi:hypothetical protein